MGSSSLVQTLPASTTPTTHIYSVRTIDPDLSGNSGSLSAAGPYDYVTGGLTLWTHTAAPGSPVRSLDIIELRKAIDAVRIAFGKAPQFSSAAPPSGIISAADFLALIAALDGGRTGRYPAFSYRDVVPPQAGNPILSEHVLQLRQAVD